MNRAHELFGFGIALAFLATCIGIDEAGQFILFAFGVTWGRMLPCPQECASVPDE